MINVLAYSGGKDSTALLFWLKYNDKPFKAVFCDTGWEHPYTYEYIQTINKNYLNNELITLQSKKFDGMKGLVQIKKRVPSACARFCTSELKVLPMIKWIKDQDDEVTVFQGIRAEESSSRAKMPMREFSDDYDAYIERPLLHHSTKEVFELLRRYSVPVNPLYMLGAGRVGCFPCVLVNHGELKRLSKSFPEIWDRIAELEGKTDNRSFFPPGYIPERFCNGFDEKSGKKFPLTSDVKSYIERGNKQGELWNEEPGSCMSIYNLCE